MSKRTVHVDPIAGAQKFKDDLAAMAAGQREKGPVKQRMLDKNFGLAEHKFRQWSAELTEAQTLEDTRDPTFWVGQAEKIMGFDKVSPKGCGDTIEVRKLDTGLYARLLVIEVGVGFIKTQLIEKAEPVSAELSDNSPLQTRWNAGRKTHDVIRRTDGQVMSGGFQTRASAIDWINNHTAAMAA